MKQFKYTALAAAISSIVACGGSNSSGGSSLPGSSNPDVKSPLFDASSYTPVASSSSIDGYWVRIERGTTKETYASETDAEAENLDPFYNGEDSSKNTQGYAYTNIIEITETEGGLDIDEVCGNDNSGEIPINGEGTSSLELIDGDYIYDSYDLSGDCEDDDCAEVSLTFDDTLTTASYTAAADANWNLSGPGDSFETGEIIHSGIKGQLVKIANTDFTLDKNSLNFTGKQDGTAFDHTVTPTCIEFLAEAEGGSYKSTTEGEGSQSYTFKAEITELNIDAEDDVEIEFEKSDFNYTYTGETYTYSYDGIYHNLELDSETGDGYPGDINIGATEGEGGSSVDLNALDVEGSNILFNAAADNNENICCYSDDELNVDLNLDISATTEVSPP